MKTLFDAHTHVQFPVYDNDRLAVIERAQKAGVKMIAVGTQAETSEAGIELAKKYPKDVWATVGFHPNHIEPLNPSGSGAWYHDKKEQRSAEPEKFDAARLKKLAQDEKVVAIGECGLDYFRIMNHEAEIKEKQRQVFFEQAQIANDLNKPLMIHCRPSKGTDDAYEDLVSLIHDSKFIIPSVMHFHVGSFSITKKLLETGCYFTFGGVITFARDYDDVINYLPLDRIMLETDAPYVAPSPYRGQRNEPAYVLETAKKLAEIRGENVEKIMEQTTANALAVFKIKL